MSFEQKNTWTYLVLAIVIPAIYFATILGQVPGTPVGEIDFIVPMITAIGLAIVISIVGSIAVSIVTRSYVTDERDKHVNRRGDSVGFAVLGALVIGPLALAMLEAEPFWIANSIYCAEVLAAIVASIVKLVAYRKGV
jgi:hypothetical protein